VLAAEAGIDAAEAVPALRGTGVRSSTGARFGLFAQAVSTINVPTASHRPGLLLRAVSSILFVIEPSPIAAGF
jgi:hypothetical protein